VLDLLRHLGFVIIARQASWFQVHMQVASTGTLLKSLNQLAIYSEISERHARFPVCHLGSTNPTCPADRILMDLRRLLAE
jgi:hypothetical protein